MHKHADGVAQTLKAISDDFTRLRWLSFASSFLGHFQSAELRHAGFVSVYSMRGLVCHPEARNRMDERTARAWFDSMEAIQATLHGMENAQQASMSKFALAGMVSAFLAGVVVLLATLCMVLVGFPGWLSILGFLAAAVAYATASIGLDKRMRRQGEDVAAKLLSTCGRLPACLWSDIQTETSLVRLEATDQDRL